MRFSSRHVLPRRRVVASWGIGFTLIAGCSGGTIGDQIVPTSTGTSGTTSSGTGSTGSTSSGTGTTSTGTTTSGTGGTTTGGGPMLCQDQVVRPGTAPLRRITRFEYNNTLRDLLGDTTSPATLLPPEESGNGFGNDAAAQSVSSLLAEEYGTVAEEIAARATASTAQLAKLAPCATSVIATTEEACARTIIESFTPKAYRRPLAAGEADSLLALEKSTRALTGATFATAIAAVIEAVLQSPDFLYKIEWGVADAARPDLKRPSGDEMATRLSYLFWGTLPDDTLRQAVQNGELVTSQGVLANATRMLNDARARPVVRFFFDNLLPISGLTDLERDPMLFPTYSATLGSYMHEETQRFLEYQIFEGPGTWTAALTSSYTFLNGPLATFYGIPNVTGTTFQKVDLDPTKRIGFITQGGVMAGTAHSNTTNPVTRGSFVVQKLMCREIPLPSGDILAKVKPPDPYSAKTARERFTLHKTEPVCASCHQYMDPVGFTLENYDAIGLWRDQENGVTIDASGTLPGTDGTVGGPVEMVKKLATTDDAQSCFAFHWLDFAYGRRLGTDDECAQAAVYDAFKKSGYDVKQMLLALTQTDEFLYFPTSRP